MTEGSWPDLRALHLKLALGHTGYQTEGHLETCTVRHFGAACWKEQGRGNRVPKGPLTTHTWKDTLATALFVPFESSRG